MYCCMYLLSSVNAWENFWDRGKIAHNSNVFVIETFEMLSVGKCLQFESLNVFTGSRDSNFECFRKSSVFVYIFIEAFC